VVDEDGALLLHLSRLAKHTLNLLADGRVSLALSEMDDGRSDPQTLARITLDGSVVLVERDSTDYQAGRECYLARLPDAAMLFDFADFSLFRLTPQSGRYVEGFGSTHRLTAERLRSLLAAS
jgi:putative heme iron utilization protein